MFKVINLTTKEILFESDEKVSVGILVDNKERIVATATKESITTYLRDTIRDRADIKSVRSGWGLYNRMEI